MGLGGIDLISHEQAKVQIRLNDFIAEPNAEVRLHKILLSSSSLRSKQNKFLYNLAKRNLIQIIYEQRR